MRTFLFSNDNVLKRIDLFKRFKLYINIRIFPSSFSSSSSSNLYALFSYLIKYCVQSFYSNVFLNFKRKTQELLYTETHIKNIVIVHNNAYIIFGDLYET